MTRAGFQPPSDTEGYDLVRGAWTDDFGVKIFVRSPLKLDGDPDAPGYSKAISDALCDAEHAIQCAYRMEAAKRDPATKERADAVKASIRAAFNSVVFMEPIPNEYWCDHHALTSSPWFIVTTAIGHFKTGWRKRVLVLDWSRTLCAKTASELFPGEDVTMGDRDIHAWGYDKLGQYVAAIFAATEANR